VPGRGQARQGAGPRQPRGDPRSRRHSASPQVHTASRKCIFSNTFPPEFGVNPRKELANKPELIITPAEKTALAEADYVVKAAQNVVSRLGLAKK